MDEERQRQMDLLEGRSRRRAWLNMRLAGGPADTAELSKPYKSSRIAQQSWSGEDFEYAPDRDEEDDDQSFLQATAEEFPRPPSRLFLPYDSDEEDDEDDARSADIQRGLELLGLQTPTRSWRSLLHDKPLVAEEPSSYSGDAHLPDPYDEVDKDLSAIVHNVSIVGEQALWTGEDSFMDF
ncbi:hypothetical protein HDZ31DRAFT_43634 [Schizophyllum fasciatum]